MGQQVENERVSTDCSLSVKGVAISGSNWVDTIFLSCPLNVWGKPFANIGEGIEG